MTDKINDGGPAFPVYDADSGLVIYGATIRDYFAGQALVGLLAIETKYDKRSQSGTAREAYEYADAMIEEREVK